MECHFDFVTAKKNGLEWNRQRALFGLLKEGIWTFPEVIYFFNHEILISTV